MRRESDPKRLCNPPQKSVRNACKAWTPKVVPCTGVLETECPYPYYAAYHAYKRYDNITEADAFFESYDAQWPERRHATASERNRRLRWHDARER
jgi:hypothetical protein